MKNENKTKIRRSDVVVACMDGDICGFAIPEYIERQESCCRRAEKFCRISEFGVDAALRRDAVRFCEAAGFETYRQYMEVKP